VSRVTIGGRGVGAASRSRRGDEVGREGDVVVGGERPDRFDLVRWQRFPVGAARIGTEFLTRARSAHCSDPAPRVNRVVNLSSRPSSRKNPCRRISRASDNLFVGRKTDPAKDGRSWPPISTVASTDGPPTEGSTGQGWLRSLIHPRRASHFEPQQPAAHPAPPGVARSLRNRQRSAADPYPVPVRRRPSPTGGGRSLFEAR
jgi:hypothetical protein